jgi:hypothetical protein
MENNMLARGFGLAGTCGSWFKQKVRLRIKGQSTKMRERGTMLERIKDQ